MQNYVVGFLFDNPCQNVLLIRKTKPEWQRGYLNGVGGKVELGETSAQALVREFQEEAGLVTDNWLLFHGEVWEDAAVDFYCLRHAEEHRPEPLQLTEEVVSWVAVADLQVQEVVYNLHYLIPMALSRLPGNNRVNPTVQSCMNGL